MQKEKDYIFEHRSHESKAFNIMRKIRRVTCSAVAVSMFMMPVWAVGSETNMSAIGREAQSFATDIANKIKKNPNNFENGTLTVTMPDGSTQTINQNELQGAVGKPNSNISSSMSMDDIEALTEIYNDSDKMSEQGDVAKENLFKESEAIEKGGKASLEGYIYSVLNETYLKRPDIDMSKDPMFDKTNEIIGDLEDIVAGLADCSAETIIKDKTNVKHIPDYKECTQVLDYSGTCTLNHHYTAGIIQHYQGPYNLDTCGTGCAVLWIGKVGDNYWGGHCTIHEQNTVYQMVNPGAVKKAVLEYTKWDDYMQVLIGPPGQEKLVWQGPNSNFPPETGGPCELSTSWSRNPNLDVTTYFKDVPHNALVNFKIRASVTRGGEGFGRIRIYYEPSKTVYEESWSPQDCLDTLNALNDGFATGSVKCTEMPPLDANGCTTDNGVVVCPQDMQKPPHPSINPLCKKMSVTTKWDYYKGEMDCWKDANGNTQCPQNVGGKLDSCKEFENNPDCQFIRSQCTEGASGASGTCYVNDVVYDCGKDVPVTESWADTQYKCPGDIACMGNECIDTNKEVSTDFSKVTALLNALQYMTQDMSCTGINDDGDFTQEENVTCTVFAGEAGECKQAVGGIADCCESVPGVGIATYISLIKKMADLDSVLSDTERWKGSDSVASQISGQYVELKQGVGEWFKATDLYKEFFASGSDSIGNVVSELYNTVDQFITQLQDQIKKKCAEILDQIFQSVGIGNKPPIVGGPGQGGDQAAGQAAEQVGEKVTQTAGEAFLSNAATVFTVVSWIYTAYVVATMIIQAVYSCEEAEFELVSNRDLGNCHFVGSYCKSKVLGKCIEKRKSFCCYQSPLSRIMNEQVRLQGDLLGAEFDGFGSARHPKCNGIPLDKIHMIDWDRVDLSEWIAILESTGNMPNNDTITLDLLTGKGSKLDFDGARLNSIERTVERLKDTEIDEARKELGKTMEVDRGFRKE